ncbi:hypothetical protein Val02_83970 [Virgisporangium aliadipatigenens]|uniref:Uncharacterized protein n=1 Tax=Virgisporangium aliadipatigenens TaxID=741659 RepID=A0A8J3YU10_9ACTN|nr:hypothetical protein [Virgisporangium aliadipatigenens]GIJ51511.1 hypothetical protein Val02_83970 [Virgisporangium aliadipatigenens]
MFGRRRAQAHGQLARAELGQGFEHFRMAAAHAASGTADYVSPKVATAKKKGRNARKATASTFGPMVTSARDGSRNVARTARKSAIKGKAKLTGREPQVRRWPTILGGLLAAGAAIGATGAIIARRRANRSQWEEYGTTHTTSRSDSMIESARSTMESGKDKVQSLAESAKERASDMMSSGSSPSPSSSHSSSGHMPSGQSSSTGTSSTGSGSIGSTGGSSEFGSRDDIYGRAGSSSNNSRS